MAKQLKVKKMTKHRKFTINYMNVTPLLDIVNNKVDFGPRTFFFLSLREKYPNIAQAAWQSMDFTDTSNDTMNQEYLDTIKLGLEFLEKTYKNYQKEEWLFFSEKLKNFIENIPETNLREKYEKLLAATFALKDGQLVSIDYGRFIILLNDFNTDLNMLQKDVNKLSTDMRKTSDGLIKALNDINEIDNVATGNYTALKSLYNQIIQNRSATTLENLLVNVADKIHNINNNNENPQIRYNVMKQYLVPLVDNDNTKQVILDTTELLDKTSTKQGLAYFNEILKYLLLYRANMEEIFQQSTELQEKRDSQLLQLSNKLIQHRDLLEQEGMNIETTMKSLDLGKIQKGKRNKQNITGLTRTQRQKIFDYINQNNPKYFKEENKLRLQGSYASIGSQDNFMDQIRQGLGMTENTEVEVLEQKVKDILALEKSQNRKAVITLETETGAAMSMTLLYDFITTLLSGKKNKKSDFIAIAKVKFDDLIDQQTTQQLLAAIADFFQQYEKNFDDLTKTYNQMLKLHPDKFNIITETAANLDAERELVDNILTLLKNNNIDTKELENFFIIDDSDKFAATFTADLGGFEGGTLGTDVEAQIENINNMLYLGGITPLDAKKLERAILNAGDGMIGARQRPALERYLSLTASLLMFRSGGSNIVNWTKEAQGLTTAPSLHHIHVYHLQDKLIPESFILKQTWENLKNCVNYLEAYVTKGSGAKIYNNVTEANKAQGYIKTEKGQHFLKIGNWEKTANNNYKSVKIEMVLLANFLDVLEEMENIMKQYQS